MMSILPIGAVIEVEGSKALIVAHRKKENENKYKYYYICVPYPRGYVGLDKMIAVPFDEDIKVLYEGYLTQGGKQYVENLETVSQFADHTNKIAMDGYETIVIEAFKKIGGQ